VKLSLSFGWLFAPLCALGIIHLWRTKQHGLLCVLLSPVAFCLIASFLHRYPFHSQLILFTMPHVLILLSYGIIHMSSYSRLRGWLFSGAYGLQLVCAASFPLLNIHIPAKEYGMTCHTLPLAKSRVTRSSLTYTPRKWLDIIRCWLIWINGSGFPMPTSSMNGRI
jgi:hypothetical protein